MKAVYLNLDESFVSVLESTVNQGTINLSEYSIEDLDESDEETVLDSQIRPTRDQLLKASDEIWIEKSSKAESLTAINTYKQALRDFPGTIDFSEVEYIDQLVWPVMGE